MINWSPVSLIIQYWFRWHSVWRGYPQVDNSLVETELLISFHVLEWSLLFKVEIHNSPVVRKERANESSEHTLDYRWLLRNNVGEGMMLDDGVNLLEAKWLSNVIWEGANELVFWNVSLHPSLSLYVTFGIQLSFIRRNSTVYPTKKMNQHSITTKFKYGKKRNL